MGKHIRKTKIVPKVSIALQDWPNLLMQLQAAGYKKEPIARVIGVSKELLYNIQSGKSEPRYSAGVALLLLLETTKPPEVCNEHNS